MAATSESARGHVLLCVACFQHLVAITSFEWGQRNNIGKKKSMETERTVGFIGIVIIRKTETSGRICRIQQKIRHLPSCSESEES